MPSILAYGFGLSSCMGSTFYKNVAKCWSSLVRIRQKSKNLVRISSAWVRLGSYSARMDPTGSGKPLGRLPASKPPPLPGKSKNPGFRGFGEIPSISPYYPGLGL